MSNIPRNKREMRKEQRRAEVFVPEAVPEPTAVAVLDPPEEDTRTVKQLKAAAIALGVSTKGNKAALLATVQEAENAT